MILVNIRLASLHTVVAIVALAVSCGGPGDERADARGIESADARGIESADARGIESADARGIESAADVAETSATNDAGAEAAADVIRRYYAAIAMRDYRRAHALWSGEGRASGQTPDEFAAGFASTARVEVHVGVPGRVEGAAGSRFVEIPVDVRAVTDAGEEQRFEGSYVLRRSVVDGATAAQRRWRIASANLSRVR